MYEVQKGILVHWGKMHNRGEQAGLNWGGKMGDCFKAKASTKSYSHISVRSLSWLYVVYICVQGCALCKQLLSLLLAQQWPS